MTGVQTCALPISALGAAETSPGGLCPRRGDGFGRVLIAPELRSFAQLEKQVHLVGQGDHFELWSDAGWQKQQEAIFALGTELLPAGWENLPL